MDVKSKIYVVSKHDVYNGTSHLGIYNSLQEAQSVTEKYLKFQSREHSVDIRETQLGTQPLLLVERCYGKGKVENPWD